MGTTAPKPGRRKCLDLGPRVEFRPGCGGWKCRHRCDSHRPDAAAHLGGTGETVPARQCKTCPAFADDGPFV